MKKLITTFLIATLLFSKIASACELGCMLGISIGLHMMAAAIYIEQKPSTINPTAKPFIVNLAPKAPASSTVPAGWAAGATQYDIPVPPLTATPSGGGVPQPDTSSNDAYNLMMADIGTFNTSLNCSQYTQNGTASASSFYVNDTSNSKYVLQGTCNYPNYPYSTGMTPVEKVYKYGSGSGGTSPVTCPTGYTSTNGACNLTNPDSVPLPADGQKVMQRVGNTIASPRDTNDALPDGATQPDPYSVNYAYPDGGYVDVKIDPVTGVTTITNSVYDPSSNTTKTETASLGAPSSSGSTGVPIDSYSSSVTNGSGASGGSNGGPLTGSGSSATGDDIAKSANSINEKNQALSNKLENLLKGFDTASPALKASTDTDLNKLDNILTPKEGDLPLINVSWLPNFMPNSFTACVPFPIDVAPTFGLAMGMHGHGEIDICDKLDFAKSLFGWMLGLFTVFYIFRVFMRANVGVL
jgi:hypothetical protein